MTEIQPTLAPLRLADLHGELTIELDPVSGLPIRLQLGQGSATRSIPFALRPTIRLDGEEEQTAARTLNYPGTRDVAEFQLLDAAPTLRIDGPTAIHTVLTRAAEWTVRWEYTIRPHHPRIELHVELGPFAAIGKSTLRDLWLDAEVALPDPGSWRLEAPGNQLRPGIGADALRTPVHVSPAGGLMGSSGLVALHHPDRDLTFLWWPFSRTEIGDPAVQSVDGGMRLIFPTGLAGRLSPGEWIRYGALYLDLLDESWPAVLAELPRWYAGLDHIGKHLRGADRLLRLLGRLPLRPLPHRARSARRPRPDPRPGLHGAADHASPAIPQLQRPRLRRHRYLIR